MSQDKPYEQVVCKRKLNLWSLRDYIMGGGRPWDEDRNTHWENTPEYIKDIAKQCCVKNNSQIHSMSSLRNKLENIRLSLTNLSGTTVTVSVHFKKTICDVKDKIAESHGINNVKDIFASPQDEEPMNDDALVSDVQDPTRMVFTLSAEETE